MSHLLVKWANEDVGLSVPVTNLDDDFATGYLLGDLLSRFNQQSDFSEFKRGDSVDAKLNNFTRLEPTLRRLGVPFDTKIAQALMTKQKGAAAKVVYNVKAALEKVRAPTVGRPGDKAVKLAVLQDRGRKPGFEAREHELFDKALRAASDNQTEVLLTKHLT